MRSDALLLVRDAQPADADAVGEVHARALAVAYRDIFEPDFLSKLVEERRTLWQGLFGRADFAETTLLVAERVDRIVGFVHFGPYAERNGDGEIYTCYVHPDVWRSGVASSVVSSAWDQLRHGGYPTVRLWTLAGANRSRSFYTSKGFIETGKTRERDFGDGRPVLQVEYARACAGAPR